MSTFKTKRVWHSALKYSSPLVVMFNTGQILKSKYTTEGMPDVYMIYFNVRGDEDDYYYTIENNDIQVALEKVIPEQWYELTATGSKDDAIISLVPMDDSDLPAIETVATDVKKEDTPDFVEYGVMSRTTGAPGDTRYDGVVSYCTGSQESNMEACLVAAKEVFSNTFGLELKDFSAEDRAIIERLAVSMFIQSNMNKFRLPISIPAVVENEKAKSVEIEEPVVNYVVGLSDLKELAAGLPLKSGTSHDGKQLKRILDKIESATKMDTATYETAWEWALAEAEFQTPSVDLDDDLPF